MKFMTKVGLIIGANIIGASIACYVTNITREKANEEFLKAQLEYLEELEKMGKTEEEKFKELKKLADCLEEVEKLNKGK